MKLAYSSLACTDWTWEQLLDGAVRYGYQGIELRLCGGEVDLTKAEPFASGRFVEARAALAQAGLTVVGLGSSCRLHAAEDDPGQLAHARAYIDMAAALGAPYVRVFGDRMPPERPVQETLRIMAGALRELADYAQPKGVTVLLETHGDFVRSAELREVMEQVNHPAAGLLWDAHHTWRFGGEPLAQTWAMLNRWFRHYHIKDSRLAGDKVQYCLLGEGEFPVVEFLGLIERSAVWVSLEHEKKWHPELDPPEVALPQFNAYMSRRLSS